MLMIKHFLMQTATNLISSFRISASSPVVPFNQKLHWQGSRMADFGGYILLHRVKLTIEGLTIRAAANWQMNPLYRDPITQWGEFLYPPYLCGWGNLFYFFFFNQPAEGCVMLPVLTEGIGCILCEVTSIS